MSPHNGGGEEDAGTGVEAGDDEHAGIRRPRTHSPAHLIAHVVGCRGIRTLIAGIVAGLGPGVPS
jgi:hypothetical protein